MHHCTKFMVHLQSGKDADVFDQEDAENQIRHPKNGKKMQTLRVLGLRRTQRFCSDASVSPGCAPPVYI